MTAAETARVVWNPNATAAPPPATGRAPREFHRKLPGYNPSPLHNAPGIAQKLGVGAVLLKDESSRMGLPAFKILGASWAVYRALDQHIGGFKPWATIEDLRSQLEAHLPLSLSAATDGNHGRAVARMAKLLGLGSTIYVPEGTSQARIDGIASEDADVVVFPGSYDEAIVQAATDANERRLVIADTSWPGYEDVPRWVVDGYSTIFNEVDEELHARGEAAPDVVVVQIGVGSLAMSVVTHYRQPGIGAMIVGVEPLSADCMLRSVQAGEVVHVPGPHTSIMAGLNAGEPSLLAWPVLRGGIELFVSVDDERAREGMRLMAAEGIVGGETGAGGLAGMLELLNGPQQDEVRTRLGLTDSSRLLFFITEGITDPAAYAEIVGPSS